MIQERTEGEKRAYLQGYRAAIKELMDLTAKMTSSANTTEFTIDAVGGRDPSSK